MKLILLLAGLAVFPTISQAEIFKCLNPAGKIVFKDSACAKNETLEQKIDSEALSKRTASKQPDLDDGNPLGKNLVRNASFENKLIDWKVPLGALWTSNGGINGSGALTIQAEKPPDDKYIHETVVEQCVALGAGEKFKFAAQFRSIITPLQAHANRANVIWYESTDCTTGGQWGAYIEPEKFKANWQKLSRINLTPALGARAAKITIVQNGRFSDGGRGYWDNVIFVATQTFERSESNPGKNTEIDTSLKPGENHLLNGKFHNDIVSWRPGWETEWSGIQGDSYPGSAKVTAVSEYSSVGRGAFNQCVNIGEYSNFELGASFKRYKASTQKGGGRLRVTWYGSQNCRGAAKTDTNSADPVDSDGWQKLRITNLTPPPNSQSAKIEIIQTVLGKGQFTAYWDDIYFEAVQ